MDSSFISFLLLCVINANAEAKFIPNKLQVNVCGRCVNIKEKKKFFFERCFLLLMLCHNRLCRRINITMNTCTKISSDGTGWTRGGGGNGSDEAKYKRISSNRFYAWNENEKNNVRKWEREWKRVKIEAETMWEWVEWQRERKREKVRRLRLLNVRWMQSSLAALMAWKVSGF